MKNFIQGDNTVVVTAGLPIKSGDGVLTGDLFGIAAHAAASGDCVSILTTGVFSLPKTSAQAWTVGAKIHWDAANGEATTAATSGGQDPVAHTFIGHAIEPAANPSASGVVRLSI